MINRYFLIVLFSLFLTAPVISQVTTYGWTQKASMPGPARHRSVAFSIGNRGYMGLGHVNSVGDIQYRDWWEYDPGTNSWTQKANYGGGKRYHAAGFAIGNKGYVGTGRDTTFNNKVDFWEYDPVTNLWTQKANFAGQARRGAVGFSIGSKGYIGTGSYFSDFWCYDPALDQWTQVSSLPAAGRTSSVGFSIGSKGYCGTGDIGGPTADFFEYNPSTNMWTPRASLPGLPRMEACGFALNGYGYIGTGDNFSSGTNYGDFWRFDPVANSWVQIMDFSGIARRYMVAFTIGNRGYTGLGTNGTNFNDLWEYGNISGLDESIAGKQSLAVFPNPVTEHSTVFIDEEMRIDGAELFIYDLQGKVVWRKNLDAHETILKPENLKNGVYFLSVIRNGNILGDCKIVLCR